MAKFARSPSASLLLSNSRNASASFLSVAGAGPDGMIVYSVDLGLKARVGILAYWWQGAREVLRYTFPRFRVRTGDRQLEATLVVVGRTKNYGGPFKITDQADLFEDQFEVMALTTQSGFRYLSYLPTLWMGNLRKEEDVHFWKAESLVCEPLDANPVYAQVDGEPLARLPIEFTIVPRALKLLVPRDAGRSNGSAPLRPDRGHRHARSRLLRSRAWIVSSSSLAGNRRHVHRRHHRRHRSSQCALRSCRLLHRASHLHPLSPRYRSSSLSLPCSFTRFSAKEHRESVFALVFPLMFAASFPRCPRSVSIRRRCSF